MDVGRSCYQVLMRLQEGADPVVVTWGFAKRGADLIGVPTPFCSANWEIGDDLRFASYLGEQAGPRPWRNGQLAAGLVGKRLCFPLQWFAEGVPAGESIQVPVDRSELPLCCQETDGNIGGVIVNGDGTAPPPFNCALLIQSCVADDWGPQCAFLSGPTLPKTGPCEWSGSWATWSGTFDTRIKNPSGTEWIWEIDTSPQTVYTVAGTVDPPVHPIFHVPDLSLTLFAAGIPCGSADLGFTVAYP